MTPSLPPLPDHHLTFMRRAIELSRHGVLRRDGGPFGAVIVKDGQIVGEGWNRVIATNDPTAHGEVEAIRDAGRRLGTFVLAGCDLYTSAEPCPMCLAPTTGPRPRGSSSGTPRPAARATGSKARSS